MQEVKKSHNQDLKADPAWSINSGKIESNLGDFPNSRWIREKANSPGMKGLEMLFPSVVGTFHRSDTLLPSLVDSRFLVLCALYFTSCCARRWNSLNGFTCKKEKAIPIALRKFQHFTGSMS